MEFNYPLPNSWKWVTLAELANPKGRAIVSGPFGSNISSKFFVDAGIPVIRGNNLTTGSTKFVDDGFVFVTPEKSKELGNVDAVCDDIIFTAAGSLGQVGIIPESTKFPKYIISNKQLRVRLNPEVVDPLFAFQWLSSAAMVAHIQQQNTGSSVPLINLSIIRRLPIPLPPLAEQSAIASVLGALDDKIELNQRMNATLEAMARALFQSWFVDFDPVRTKLDGGHPFGMHRASAELFPAKFRDTECGVIPEHWRTANLEAIAKVSTGARPGARSDIESPEYTIPLYGGGGRMGYTNAALFETPILFTGRVGTLGRIFRAADPSWPSDNTLVVEPRTGYFDFAYFVLQSFDLITLNRGSTQPLLTQSDLKRQSFVLPSDEVVKEFSAHSGPLFKRMVSNDKEAKILTVLRDTLLPRLLSGELRIPAIN